MTSRTILNWLRFFRFVNLPTVPGDVLAGAAALLAAAAGDASVALAPRRVAAAALAACALYLFGLADNDIVGAKTDGPERPIPSGAISLRAARLARGLCLFAAPLLGAAADLPSVWWIAACALAAAIALYNRTKSCLLMGLCRGLNVLCGGAALMTCAHGALGARALPLGAVAILWTLYIAGVTRFSEGESADPVRRHAVGLLIGALVYLQLGALLAAYLCAPSLALRNLLLAGAGLLVLLRLMKRLLPRVSAS